MGEHTKTHCACSSTAPPQYYKQILEECTDFFLIINCRLDTFTSPWKPFGPRFTPNPPRQPQTGVPSGTGVGGCVVGSGRHSSSLSPSFSRHRHLGAPQTFFNPKHNPFCSICPHGSGRQLVVALSSHSQTGKSSASCKASHSSLSRMGGHFSGTHFFLSAMKAQSATLGKEFWIKPGHKNRFRNYTLGPTVSRKNYV